MELKRPDAARSLDTLAGSRHHGEIFSRLLLPADDRAPSIDPASCAAGWRRSSDDWRLRARAPLLAGADVRGKARAAPSADAHRGDHRRFSPPAATSTIHDIRIALSAHDIAAAGQPGVHGADRTAGDRRRRLDGPHLPDLLARHIRPCARGPDSPARLHVAPRAATRDRGDHRPVAIFPTISVLRRELPGSAAASRRLRSRRQVDGDRRARRCIPVSSGDSRACVSAPSRRRKAARCLLKTPS